MLSLSKHSLYSKRARSLAVSIPRRLLESSACDAVFDSAGLEVFGEGEWKVRRYGAGKRRRWMKPHFAVNLENKAYIAVALTEETVGDGEALPP